MSRARTCSASSRSGDWRVCLASRRISKMVAYCVFSARLAMRIWSIIRRRNGATFLVSDRVIEDLPRVGMVRRQPIRQRSINGGKDGAGQAGKKADGGTDQPRPNLKLNGEPEPRETAAYRLH
ncbi:MAG: hypothetical protein OXL68_09210 [Paracoccaceae bacterium]|nr:hypothetical protein [Paracoccaceae bacterium]